mmetsp:Transcript_19410/g.35147  ORF Transcript_19410/g.35147 Transcript_19410/m.35147 type:complete len:95 (+) Transcript_19410:924-1208(+)
MVDAFIKLAPVNLPARDAGDEPLWLKHSRQAVLRRRIYQPNEEDFASLANTDYFHFYLKEFYIRILTDSEWGDEVYEFENQNEYMVALEGLCWE